MGIRLRIAVIISLTSLAISRADIVDVFGGTHANWPSGWTSLGLNDGDDGITTSTSLEIRGDATHPAVAYAQDNNFVYFRLQLGAATLDTAVNGSYLIYVDRVGSGNDDGRPDFAFAWDAKSNDNLNHGLEMTKYLSGSGTWGSLRMSDMHMHYDVNFLQHLSDPELNPI